MPQMGPLNRNIMTFSNRSVLSFCINICKLARMSRFRIITEATVGETLRPPPSASRPLLFFASVPSFPNRGRWGDSNRIAPGSVPVS